MRNAVFILAAVQIALLILYAVGSGMSDPAGNAMSQAFITLGGILMAILLIPALILAINRKALGVALAERPAGVQAGIWGWPRAGSRDRPPEAVVSGALETLIRRPCLC